MVLHLTSNLRNSIIKLSYKNPRLKGYLMIKTKLAALLLCLITAVTTILTSCGGEEKTVKTAEPQKVTNVYSTQFMSLPEDCSPNGRDVIYSGGRLYMRCMRVIDEENYEYENVLYSVDENGENPETVTLPADDDNYLSAITVDSDGNYCVVYQSYNSETMVSSYIFKKYSPDWEELLSFDPSAMFPASNDGYGIYINNVFLDDEGNYYLASNNAIIVVSPEGAKLFDITFENYLNSIGRTGDSKIYAQYYDMNGGGQVYKIIDTASKRLGSELSLPADIGNNSDIYLGDGYDYYYKNETGVYGVNSEDTDSTKLLDWINSDVNPNSVNSIVVINADKFIYSGYDQITYDPFIAILNRVPDDQVTAKYIIKLACIYSDYNLTNYIVKFNQTNDTYRVVVNDYSQYNTDGNYDLGEQTLTNEIVAGNVPDILSFNGLDADKYISKDIFVDLYEYLDSESSSLRRDDLLACVTTPFEYNGILPRMVSTFSITTIAGKTSNIGSAASWTISDMLKLRDSLEDGQSLFDESNMTKTAMLNMLLAAGYTEFVNGETGECSFNSDSFISLLEYCNTLPAEYNYDSEYDYSADQYASLRNDEIILTNTSLYGFDEYLRLKFEFGNETINLIGYPTASGSGSLISPDASYGITKDSAVKDGAWQFISYIMSDDCLSPNSMRGMYSLPATISALNAAAAYQMKLYYFFDYSGGWSSSDSPIEYDEYNTPESGMPGHLEQSDVDELMAYLDTLTSTYSRDSELMKIITEEAAYYFGGSKTAADVAAVIQSRAAIYVSEHM